MAEKILLIDRAAFIDWYFDQDMRQSFLDLQDVVQELSDTGKFTIDAQALLDNTGYLPENVVAPDQEVILDDMGEVNMGAYDKITFA